MLDHERLEMPQLEGEVSLRLADVTPLDPA
jgi:hypothetical protein